MGPNQGGVKGEVCEMRGEELKDLESGVGVSVPGRNVDREAQGGEWGEVGFETVWVLCAVLTLVILTHPSLPPELDPV